MHTHTHTHTHLVHQKKKKKGGDIIIINSKSHNLFCFLDMTAWETAALHFHLVFHSIQELVFNTDIQRNSKSFTRPGPRVVKWSGTGPCGWAPYGIQCFALVTPGSSRYILFLFYLMLSQLDLPVLEFPTVVIHLRANLWYTKHMMDITHVWLTSKCTTCWVDLLQGGGGEVISKVKSGCVRELSTSATVVKKLPYKKHY